MVFLHWYRIIFALVSDSSDYDSAEDSRNRLPITRKLGMVGMVVFEVKKSVQMGLFKDMEKPRA